MTRSLTAAGRDMLLARFRAAKKRLLFLDYDGTLAPIVRHYSLAAPDPEILKLLENFCSAENNQLVIVSGRDRKTISDWIRVANCSFIAEHGAWIKDRDQDWIQSKGLAAEWKEQVRPVLETYSDRLPGAFIEEKEFSLAWHFRSADPGPAPDVARELTAQLITLTADKNLQVLQGKKVVEIRNAGVDKGLAAAHWLEKGGFDFILAAGDDQTDEDLFRALPETAYSIKVGFASSLARFHMAGHREILGLIAAMNEN